MRNMDPNFLTQPLRTGLNLPQTWDTAGLELVGFQGFVPFLGVSRSVIPIETGVYAVLRPVELEPTFLPANLGKTLKPYAFWDLQQRWLSGVEVIYIGKAGGKGGLRGRLGPFSRMAKNHSGGRSIWQLDNPEVLIVAWMPTSHEFSAEEVEDRLLTAFYVWHGRLPFANISMSRQSRAVVDALSDNQVVFDRWATFERQECLRMEQLHGDRDERMRSWLPRRFSSEENPHRPES